MWSQKAAVNAILTNSPGAVSLVVPLPKMDDPQAKSTVSHAQVLSRLSETASVL